MNDQEYLQEIYAFDPGARTFTIPVSIERYDDFSTRLDPSPAPKRDLATEVVEYLNQCSNEIPCRYPISIQLQIRADERDAQREQDCLESLRLFFRHEMFVEKSEIRRRRGDALKYLLVSFLCLSFYVVTERLGLNNFFLNLLTEAVLIGGWLFMWEAVTVNFIEMDKYNQNIKKFKRLIQAKMNFSYALK